MKRWTDQELDRDRARAFERFVQERLEEPLDIYSDRFHDALDATETFLEDSLDLSLLFGGPTAAARERLLGVLDDEDAFTVFRYLAGPPISKEDLANVSAAPSLRPSVLKKAPKALDRVVQTVYDGHDRQRFPWVSEEREPEDQEKASAISATASLIAYRKYLTWRAHRSKTDQETVVADALASAGFVEEPPRVVEFSEDGPGRGAFCRESKVRDVKADLLVRLGDRRLLAVDCKTSGSETNSWKRLNRVAGGKSSQWTSELGFAIVPAVVLSGVYSLTGLRKAQSRGLSIFWTHDLEALIDWIGPPST